MTSLKARMFNDKYLGEVNFWRDYLANGSPRFVLDFGNQSAIISTEFLNFDVTWPGIPGDDLPFKNQSYEEDLFSLAGLGRVVKGEDLDWEDDETGRTTMTPMPTRLLPLELSPPRTTAEWLEEPNLLFAGEKRHIDPKTGITLYGPRSFGTPPPQAGGARRLHRHGRVGRRRPQVLPTRYVRACRATRITSRSPAVGRNRATAARSTPNWSSRSSGTSTTEILEVRKRTATVRGIPRLAPAEDGPDHPA